MLGSQVDELFLQGGGIEGHVDEVVQPVDDAHAVGTELGGVHVVNVDALEEGLSLRSLLEQTGRAVQRRLDIVLIATVVFCGSLFVRVHYQLHRRT